MKKHHLTLPTLTASLLLLLLGVAGCGHPKPVLSPAGSRVEIVTGEPDRDDYRLVARLELKGYGEDLAEALSNARIRVRNVAARYGVTIVKLDQAVKSHFIQSTAEVTLFCRVFKRK